MICNENAFVFSQTNGEQTKLKLSDNLYMLNCTIFSINLMKWSLVFDVDGKCSVHTPKGNTHWNINQKALKWPNSSLLCSTSRKIPVDMNGKWMHWN